MYKNILVPVSFEESRNVGQAVKAARTLMSEGGKVTFLHVLQDIPNYVADHIPSDLLAANKAETKARMDKLTEDIPGSAGHVVNGHPGNTILSWANDHDVDCVVVASHQPAMSDFLLGSTAQMVVRHAKCCVHVVR